MVRFTRSPRFVSCLLSTLLVTRCLVAVPPGTFSLRIAVDQFGYLPDMPKVAVISDPALGFNAVDSYTPGPTLEVRTWGSNTVVFNGAPAIRAGGATNSQSGDRNWWFDFSSITRWGE